MSPRGANRRVAPAPSPSKRRREKSPDPIVEEEEPEFVDASEAPIDDAEAESFRDAGGQRPRSTLMNKATACRAAQALHREPRLWARIEELKRTPQTADDGPRAPVRGEARRVKKADLVNGCTWTGRAWAGGREQSPP